MNIWAFPYDQKRLLQLLSTLSQNLENTMKYLYNKQDFFLAYDASHSFFTHAPKKKKSKGSPPQKKKPDKGFRIQTMQLLGEELPVSSQRLISTQQEQAGLLWNAGVAGWAA